MRKTSKRYLIGFNYIGSAADGPPLVRTGPDEAREAMNALLNDQITRSSDAQTFDEDWVDEDGEIDWPTSEEDDAIEELITADVTKGWAYSTSSFDYWIKVNDDQPK